MHAPSVEASNKPTARLATCVVLLWLAGNGLRLTILAVPPLIPLIHDDLRMSETQVGLLAGLPVFLFALAAVPGSLLTARFGALAAVLVGLAVTATGSALRAIVPGVAALYAATFVTGFGVAVMQPAMPPLVRAWLPTRIGLGTAIYANGLLIGEILPVSLMQPLVLPAVGGSWRLALAVWAVPCLVIAAIILFAAPPAPRPGGDTRPRWWPQWNSGTLWRLGFMLGGVNAAYFTTNHFLPDYLTQSGRGDLVANALIALNTGQLPGSLLLLALAGRLERRPAVYAAFGAITFAASDGNHFWRRYDHRALIGADRLRNCFGAHPPPRLAPTDQQTGGCTAHGCGDVYHQLFLRRPCSGAERFCLGHHGGARHGFRPDRHWRIAHDHPVAGRSRGEPLSSSDNGMNKFPQRRLLETA